MKSKRLRPSRIRHRRFIPPFRDRPGRQSRPHPGPVEPSPATGLAVLARRARTGGALAPDGRLNPSLLRPRAAIPRRHRARIPAPAQPVRRPRDPSPRPATITHPGRGLPQANPAFTAGPPNVGPDGTADPLGRRRLVALPPLMDRIGALIVCGQKAGVARCGPIPPLS